jgi:hypothetical protein
MAADIPRAVLSEHFQERLVGRRLVSAVFLTFQLDPGFFELQVLPVFLDASLSHADRLRTVQLEDALREVRGHIAVYYDAHGLLAGSGSAKLDIRRIPVRRPNGIFHPKNVFLLAEAIDPDEDGHRSQALLVASLSANLTRSGWWENVEVCHVEELKEGERSLLRGDLLDFFGQLRRASGGAEDDHAAVESLATFLRQRTGEREHASSGGRLHPRFFDGRGELADWLQRATGNRLRGLNLEVISPFFDDAPTCRPLRALLDTFRPPTVRVFLPRNAAEEALCGPELFDDVRQLADVSWGRLPKDLVRYGKGNETAPRFVHAKVYRFFGPDREILFIGSANLTQAAHQRGGNLETGLLVEVPQPNGAPWLLEDRARPLSFQPAGEDERVAASGGTKLDLRFDWTSGKATAFWNASSGSPALRLVGGGVTVGELPVLAPRVNTDLEPAFSAELGTHLLERSLFEVHGEEETPTLLLVQEHGMAKKPSQLMTLTTAEILKFWALLTPEQRSAFLEARAPQLAATEEGADLVHRARLALDQETFFDRFAGVFHSFACLERAVLMSITDGDGREARYRLFGSKYDSLGTLLDCLLGNKDVADDVLAYVTVLCGLQVCQQVKREHPDFWNMKENDAAALEARFAERHALRERLVASNPENMPAFLDWFDDKFLTRFAALEQQAS